MGKRTNRKPPISTRRDQRSTEAEAYRRLYKTARWKRTRDATLQRDGHLCQWCKKRGHITVASVCHHIDKASKESPATFFDGPFVSLCAECHDSDAQQQERIGYSKAVGEDGWPTDAGHPANKERAS